MPTHKRVDLETASAVTAGQIREERGERVMYVTLSDVTPNRGTVEYYGTDREAARAATRGFGDSHVYLSDGTMCHVGQRAWHRGGRAGV